jgi:hypothetical protein
VDEDVDKNREMGKGPLVDREATGKTEKWNVDKKSENINWKCFVLKRENAKTQPETLKII